MTSDDTTPTEVSFDRTVTREDLGRLGGDAGFQPPDPDRSQQIAQGRRPTAKHTWLYPWWYPL